MARSFLLLAGRVCQAEPAKGFLSNVDIDAKLSIAPTARRLRERLVRGWCQGWGGRLPRSV